MQLGIGVPKGAGRRDVQNITSDVRVCAVAIDQRLGLVQLGCRGSVVNLVFHRKTFEGAPLLCNVIRRGRRGAAGREGHLVVPGIPHLVRGGIRAVLGVGVLKRGRGDGEASGLPGFALVGCSDDLHGVPVIGLATGRERQGQTCKGNRAQRVAGVLALRRKHVCVGGIGEGARMVLRERIRRVAR